jgi:hypothetical protein
MQGRILAVGFVFTKKAFPCKKTGNELAFFYSMEKA